MTYEQFSKEYRSAFESMVKYADTPDRGRYTDKMAKLADDYPDFLARFEAEEEANSRKGPSDEAVQGQGQGQGQSSGDAVLADDPFLQGAMEELGIKTPAAGQLKKPAPAVPASPPASPKSDKDKAVDEFKQAASDIADYFKGKRCSPGPDPDLIRRVGVLIAKAVKAGYYTFKEAVQNLYESLKAAIGDENARKVINATAAHHCEGSSLAARWAKPARCPT
jgi:hypothetical protein